MQWSVDSDLHSSDHCPIYIRCDMNENATPRDVGFIGWSLIKANWTEIVERCDLRFDQDRGLENCAIITETLLKAADETIPKKKGTTKYNCPWWNEDCKNAVRLKKRTLNRFRRSHQTAHLMEYKAAKANARRVIRNAKRVLGKTTTYV